MVDVWRGCCRSEQVSTSYVTFIADSLHNFPSSISSLQLQLHLLIASSRPPADSLEGLHRPPSDLSRKCGLRAPPEATWMFINMLVMSQEEQLVVDFFFLHKEMGWFQSSSTMETSHGLRHSQTTKTHKVNHFKSSSVMIFIRAKFKS